MTVEVAVLAPVLLMLLGAAIAGGRYELAAGAVEATASAAARAASLARTPTDAHQAAHRLATATLDEAGLHCRDTTVAVDTTAFTTPPARPAPPGTPARAPSLVTVTLTCRLDTAALAVPGLPGTTTIHATASSVLDTYRASRPARPTPSPTPIPAPSPATTRTETP